MTTAVVVAVCSSPYVGVLFYDLGEISAVHSAEFDDISINLADDDCRVANEDHRFVFCKQVFFDTKLFVFVHLEYK